MLDRNDLTSLTEDDGVPVVGGKAMRLSHQTLRDETLPHQVVLLASSSKFLNIQVSCNCLYVKEIHKYDTMGATKSLEESRQLYNDPSNHREPFSEADKAKW